MNKPKFEVNDRIRVGANSVFCPEGEAEIMDIVQGYVLQPDGTEIEDHVYVLRMFEDATTPFGESLGDVVIGFLIAESEGEMERV